MIDKKQFATMMDQSAHALFEAKDALGDIDSKFGDGDHGIAMSKAAQAISQKTDEWAQSNYAASIKKYLTDVGMAVMAIGGGSSGPLYGTMIGGLGTRLDDDIDGIDGPAAKAMFAGSLAEMQDITPAKTGDKTMMDALIPAARATQTLPDTTDAEKVFRFAAVAAVQGAEASKNFVSKFGRARSYKEQTIGTPDAGAVSISLFFEGLAKGL